MIKKQEVRTIKMYKAYKQIRKDIAYKEKEKAAGIQNTMTFEDRNKSETK